MPRKRDRKGGCEKTFIAFFIHFFLLLLFLFVRRWREIVICNSITFCELILNTLLQCCCFYYHAHKHTPTHAVISAGIWSLFRLMPKSLHYITLQAHRIADVCHWYLLALLCMCRCWWWFRVAQAPLILQFNDAIVFLLIEMYWRIRYRLWTMDISWTLAAFLPWLDVLLFPSCNALRSNNNNKGGL